MLVRSNLLIALITCLQVCFAQDQDSIALKYASLLSEESLKNHVFQLASEEFEGRETGKRGQKAAAEYIQKHFRTVGIPPLESGSYYQNFPLINQSKKGSKIKIGTQELMPVQDFYHNSGLLMKDSFQSEVVFVGYKSDDFGVDVKDKVLLVLNGKSEDDETRVTLSTRKKKALKHGVKAILLIDDAYESKMDRIEHYEERNVIRIADAGVYDSLPTFALHPKSVEKAFGKSIKKHIKNTESGKFEKSVILKNSAEIQINRKTDVLSAENVLGFVEGSDKSAEILVLTAHYDHLGVKNEKMYPGADDDGSGTAAILELSRVFSKAAKEGFRPKRSILFMAVSGEEKGLLGSKYYTNNPVFPLKQTYANLNIDMIGRHDKNHSEEDQYIYIIGADRISQDLHDVNEVANSTYANLDLDYTFNDKKDKNRFYYRSDHYNFAKHGIPVIFYFTGVHEDYHKPGDTADKLNYGNLENRVKLIFHTAWLLANREGELQVNEEN